ncbi:Ulp1 protease family, C-terminal catalytic domain containing protein [Parasponia andersonii]|uniref:Ulp1 protease family, C-terminal catalytic domain containing protein n=1 Tax=Parasponia andersonii TaxID=3476 RepID=A0A2P5DC83_PARAD|nr:Ulp1 protease family, C-terminal catalytic domain containing protein [Parasponia andersonii]
MQGIASLNNESDDLIGYIFMPEFIIYINGEKPLRGKDWENAHTIYILFNLENRHWISLAVQLDKWTILVFDNKIKMFKDSELEQFLEPFRWMIPYMMHQSSKFERYNNKMLEPFTGQRIHDIP